MKEDDEAEAGGATTIAGGTNRFAVPTSVAMIARSKASPTETVTPGDFAAQMPRHSSGNLLHSH